jgi:hypothetical protein
MRPMKVTPTSLGTGIGALVAVIVAAAIAAGRAAPKPVSPEPATPAISSPAITSEDIAAVRAELRSIQSESNQRFEVLDRRLSHLEGYVAGAEARNGPPRP